MCLLHRAQRYGRRTKVSALGHLLPSLSANSSSKSHVCPGSSSTRPCRCCQHGRNKCSPVSAVAASAVAHQAGTMPAYQTAAASCHLNG
jgi:hypothetical protein